MLPVSFKFKKFIENEYNFEIDIIDIVVGIFNESFLITTKCDQRIFLKNHKIPTEKRTLEILKAMNFFRSKKIKCPKIIFTKNKKSFINFNNNIYTAYVYILGEKFPNGEILPNKLIESYGKHIAKMHLLSLTSEDMPEIKKIFKIKSFKNFKKNSDEIKKGLKRTDDLLIDLRYLILRNLKQKEKLSLKFKVKKNELASKNFLIHGDPLIPNLIFRGTNNITLVDWEDVMYGPRMYEFIKIITYNFLNSLLKEDFTKIKIFVHFYNKIFPFTEKELDEGLNIFLCKILKDTWVETMYLNSNASDEIFYFLIRDFKRIKYLNENLDVFKKEILKSI